MALLWRLVKVFDEYDDIIIKGKAFNNRYDALYRLVKKPDVNIDLDKLKEYVDGLQKKYPLHNFQLKTVRIGKKLFYVISRKSYAIIDGKKVKVKERVPIYIDLDAQEFYIPKSYITKNRKLTNYILFRTLGSLGVAKIQYVSTVHPS